MGNKFNVLVSAAIFVSTVCYLWIKIRRRNLHTNENNMENKDVNTEIFKKEVFNDSIQDESYDDLMLASCDDFTVQTIDVYNDSGVLTQQTQSDDIISDNDDMSYLNVDDTNIINEQSFTAELCKDFKELKIATPNMEQNRSLFKAITLQNELDKSEINFRPSSKSQTTDCIEQIIANLCDDDVLIYNKLQFQEKEEGEISDDDSVVLVEDSSDESSHDLSDKVILESSIQIIEHADLEDGEIEFDDAEKSDLTYNMEIAEINTNKMILNEIKIEVSEIEDGEIVENDDFIENLVLEHRGEKSVFQEQVIREAEVQEKMPQELKEVEVESVVEVKDVLFFEHKEEESVIYEKESVEEESNFEDSQVTEETVLHELAEVLENKSKEESVIEGLKVESVFVEKEEFVLERKEVEYVLEKKEEESVLEEPQVELVLEVKEVELVLDEKEVELVLEKKKEESVLEQNEDEIVLEEKEDEVVAREKQVELVLEKNEEESEELVLEKDEEESEELVIEQIKVEIVPEKDEEESEELVREKDKEESEELVLEKKKEESEELVLEKKEEESEELVLEKKEEESIIEVKVETNVEVSDKMSLPECEEVVEEKIVQEVEVTVKSGLEVVKDLVFSEKEESINAEENLLDELVLELIAENTKVRDNDSVLEVNDVEVNKLVPEQKEVTTEESMMEEKEIENELPCGKCEDEESVTEETQQLSPTISENNDYGIDYEDTLDNLITDRNLMNYIDDCLHESSSDRTSMTLKNENSEERESSASMENWQNDEDSLNNIKRDFYELSDTVCSPHPSSESDHAHCVNNLTERVATHSAESILDNLLLVSTHNRNDSESTATLGSPIYDNDCCPELYTEKIQFGDKELDVVYFDESVLEECGVISDVRIVRTIPVGIGGRIIGKKGKTKNELLKKYGAELLIYNHPSENCKQVLQITCSPAVQGDLEKWVDKTLDQILRNTIQTTVSNPEWLKPMIPVGKMVTVQVIDMPTIQHVKLRIYDPKTIRAYNKMQTDINADYSNADSNALLPSPVAVGCICIAMIRPDYFLRAEIISIYDQYAVVYLYDLGKTHQTCLYYLFKIREKYMKVPFQVIPARMPHAVINNKKFTSAMVHRRFLCDQKTMRPRLVRAFFPRMNTCCEPCVHLYVSRSDIDGTEPEDARSVVGDSGDCVDLLELLVSVDVCGMVRETVDCSLQATMNEHHYRSFLTDKDRRLAQTQPAPIYFEPCNNKFYEDYLEFQYKDVVPPPMAGVAQ